MTKKQYVPIKQQVEDEFNLYIIPFMEKYKNTSGKELEILIKKLERTNKLNQCQNQNTNINIITDNKYCNNVEYSNSSSSNSNLSRSSKNSSTGIIYGPTLF